VCDFFEGDTVQLSRRKFSDEEKAALISHLNHSGMNLTNEQFHEVLTIARSENRKRQSETIPNGFMARYISLNNYDFDELKKEYCSIADKIDAGELRKLCPTLTQIIDETENSKDEEYPGRHLPIEFIEGRTAWRYQCLRIMDRKLFTAPYAVSNEEMERHIFAECKRLGIKLPASMWDKYQQDGVGVLQEVLKRNYAILSELISTERRQKYGRTAYRGGVRGHIYSAANADGADGPRVTAFKSMFTFDEAVRLRRELDSLSVLHFSGRKSDFDDSYPLLSVLRVLERIAKSPRAFKTRVCKACYTDLLTIDYRPGRMHQIKKNIERAISNKMNIEVEVDNRLDIFYPLVVRTEGTNWALLAINVESQKISMLQPEQLANAKIADYGKVPDYEEVDYRSHIVGLSNPEDKEIKSVVIAVTEIAYNELTRWGSDSRLARLKPTFRESVRMPVNSRLRSCYRFQIEVYLNDDFFEEMLSLDRRACLVSIEPEEILDCYKLFFREKTGREWVPLSERNGTGRLRIKND
ncbi:MAG: hypothetical protein K2L05_07035, partial [Muribaculaceae bacterium]|nr:hypothetical protein [Muribaculaceae bacterium]